MLGLSHSLAQVGERELFLAVEDVGLEVLAVERLGGLEGSAGDGSIVGRVRKIGVLWDEGMILRHVMLASCFFLHQSLQLRHVAGAEDPLLQFLRAPHQPAFELQVLGVVVQLPMPVLNGLVGDIEFVWPHSSGGLIQVDLLVELLRLPPSGPMSDGAVAGAADGAVFCLEAEGLADDVYFLAEVGNCAKTDGGVGRVGLAGVVLFWVGGLAIREAEALADLGECLVEVSFWVFEA